MAADATIKFDTRIDPEGFIKGIQGLDRNIANMKKNVAGLGGRLTESFGSKAQQNVENFTTKVEQQHHVTEKSQQQLSSLVEDTSGQLEGLSNTAIDAGKNIQHAFDPSAPKQMDVAIVGISNRLRLMARQAMRGVRGMARDLSGFRRETDRSNRRLGFFGRQIRNILLGTLIFKALRGAIQDFTSFLGRSIRTNAEFVQSLNNIRANLRTAFQPIFDAVMPALIQLMQVLARITAYLAAFLSMIFGRTFQQSRAAAQALDEQAKALEGVGGAASEANKQLASFDQINQQTAETAGGGGGVGDMWEDAEMPTFDQRILDFFDDLLERLRNLETFQDWWYLGFDIGRGLANVVSNLLESLDWDKVEEIAFRIAHLFSGFLTGFFGDVRMWGNIGYAFARGINTLLGMAHIVLTETNWARIGFAIMHGLLTALENINWGLLGEVIIEAILAPLKLLSGAAVRLGFSDLAMALHNIQEQIERTLRLIGEIIVWLWENVLAPVGTWIMNVLVPRALNLLASAFDLIYAALRHLQPTAIWFFENFIQPLARFVGNVLIWAFDAFVNILERLRENIAQVSSALAGLITMLVLYNRKLILAKITAGLKTVALGVMAAAKTVATAAQIAFNTVLKLNPIGLLIALIAGAVVAFMTWAQQFDSVGDAARQLWENIKEFFGAIASWFMDNVIQPIIDDFKLLWDNIVAIFTAIKDFFGTVIQWFFDNVVMGFVNLGNRIIEAFLSVRDRIIGWWNQVKAVLGVVAGWFMGNVIEPIQDKISRLAEIGRAIVEGLWQGISNAASWLKDRISGFASGVVDNIRSFFRIGSPSRVMAAEIGEPIAQGIALGVDENADIVANALVDSIMDAKQDSDDALDIFKQQGQEMGLMIVDGLNKSMPHVEQGMEELLESLLFTMQNFTPTLFEMHKYMLNSMLQQFETFANKYQRAVNQMVNNIIAMFNMIPEGPRFPSAPMPSAIRLPMLAQGGLIPRNKPMAVIVGDNKYEEEIVSPRSAIREEVMKALSEYGGYGGGSPQEIVLELDGFELARVLTPIMGEENQRIGMRIRNRG